MAQAETALEAAFIGEIANHAAFWCGLASDERRRDEDAQIARPARLREDIDEFQTIVRYEFAFAEGLEVAFGALGGTRVAGVNENQVIDGDGPL